LASKSVATVSNSLVSKPAATVFTSLSSKLTATVFSGFASKSVVGFLVEPQNQGGGGFFDLGLKTGSYGFGDLGLKITAMIFGFMPQNQACFSLSVASQNRRREVDAKHALRSNSLLGVEANLAKVSHSGLKTSGCATTGGARGTITEVTSETS
jgi:hypothetical protein